jgi:hypothetical protein
VHYTFSLTRCKYNLQIAYYLTEKGKG